MYFHINKILIFGFIIRVLIAIWNSFMGPSFGAEGDAFSFHLEAIEYSNNPKLEEFIIGWFYSFILGYIYYLITPTLFLGCILSCLTWLISTIYLIKIMELLNYNTSIQNKVVIIYAFLPSSILYTSVTLREVYQLLFINLSVYGVLKIIINMQFRYWILLFFSVAGMGVLHGALFAFGFILIISIFVIIIFIILIIVK